MMIPNLIVPAEALKRREARKYVEVVMVIGERPHEFEYELDGVVFDLALLDSRILVEFDGPYHRKKEQILRDEKKNGIAALHGFRVERIEVPSNSVIPAETIVGL
jgi:hypothetical protein